MNIYVGGVNGVGKSTILRRVAQIDKTFEVIHLASAMMQQLGLAPGSYDQLHELPDDQRDQAEGQVIEQLVTRVTNKTRLIDGHYLLTIWGEISYQARDWIAQLDGGILITADPAVVWHRIEQDESYRDRALFPRGMKDRDCQQFLANYIEQTRHYFDEVVTKYDLEHFVLENSSDDVDRAAQQIITFAKALGA